MLFASLCDLVWSDYSDWNAIKNITKTLLVFVYFYFKNVDQIVTLMSRFFNNQLNLNPDFALVCKIILFILVFYSVDSFEFFLNYQQHGVDISVTYFFTRNSLVCLVKNAA